MLNENIKKIRKSKGMSQEELAVKLNVVRQTISKWEQGLSVPDAEMLIRSAGEFDTSVNVLLGETIPESNENELKTIAVKLELLNEQFAKRNENRRRIWRIVFIVCIIMVVGAFLTEIAAYIHYHSSMKAISESVSIIGGSDSPTNIIVTSVSLKISSLVIAFAILVISAIGLYKTRRNKKERK